MLVEPSIQNECLVVRELSLKTPSHSRFSPKYVEREQEDKQTFNAI